MRCDRDDGVVFALLIEILTWVDQQRCIVNNFNIDRSGSK